MKGILKKIIQIVMIMVIVLSTMPVFTMAEAESNELRTTVEKQVRAYAKSINYSNADDKAASALAKHGLTGKGKDLNVGASHGLTVTLVNSEMMQEALTDAVTWSIKEMQDLYQTTLYSWGNVLFYGAGNSETRYEFYEASSFSLADEEGRDHLHGRVKYSDKTMNSYDDSLVWIAGNVRARLQINQVKISGTEATYRVNVSMHDTFDFTQAGKDEFKDFMSTLGSILFKEFSWKSSFSFDVNVPYTSCNHQMHSYHWSYDSGQDMIVSKTSNGETYNGVTKRTTSEGDDYYKMDVGALLHADQPWVMEIDAKNYSSIEISPWGNCGSVTYPSLRLRRNLFSGFYFHDYVMISEETQKEYNLANPHKAIAHTYEEPLTGINKTILYTYRYENVIDENGNNRIVLTIFNTQTGEVILDKVTMDDQYDKPSWTSKKELVASDVYWENGQDLYIDYIGTTNYPFSAAEFNLRIYEGGIESDGSAVEAVKTVKPTCISDGYTVYKCTRCNDTYNGDVVKALGHEYQPVTTNATCTEDGYVTHTCTRCKESYTEPGLEKLGHVEIMDTEAVDATCTETGMSASSHCERCDEILSEAEVIEALGHDYESVVTDPTCTESGYTTYTCTRCEEAYVDDETEALGHTFTSWEVAELATPEKEGLETRTCEVCEYIETRTFEYVEHTYETEVIESTCVEKGYTKHTCTECGFTYQDNYTDLSDHDYGQWYVETEATHEETGVERRDCELCDAYETREIDVEEHEYTSTVVAPTCTAEGYTLYTCECGESYKEEFTGMTQHSYGEMSVLKEADCLNGGTKMHVCEACGHEEIIQVEPLGHHYESEIIKPSCTEGGYTKHQCERCEESYISDPTEAKGHEMTEWMSVLEATCLESGTEMKDCLMCDYYETREVEALGHEYEEKIVNPDCVNDGYTEHSCIRCDESYIDTIVESNGHGYGEWIVELEATCLEEGRQKRICTGCSEEEIEVLPKIDHKAVIDEAVESTCTELGWTEGAHCEMCQSVLVEQEVTEALGHDEIEEVIEPTCSTVGYTLHTCSRCDFEKMDSYVPMVEHTFGKWEIIEAPTLEKEGAERRECTKCEFYETRVMAKTEHQFKMEEIEPTCSEEGYTLYTCTVCGTEVKDHVVEALGHDYGQWYLYKEATCTKYGLEARECSRCDEFEIQKTDPAGHDYNETVVEPDCTQMGYTIFECKVCGSKHEGNYTEANGHQYGQWVDIGKAECLKRGAQRRDCEVCDAFETQETDELPHDYEATLTEATCLEGGYTVYTCTRCEDTYTSDETEAAGHKMGKWNVTIEPTCLAAGKEMSQCEHCDYTETREVEALGHKYVDKGKAATCTEDGVKAEVCERCGDKKEEVELKATGHSWKTRTVSATCTRDGYTETYCEHCSQSKKSNEVSASGHSFGEYISNNDATMDADGTKTSKCSKCGKKDTVTDLGTKKVISSVSVSVPEDYTVMAGEELDASKLEMTVTFEDGTTASVSDFEVTGFDSSKTGEQELTVSFREHSDTVSITVEEANEAATDTETDQESAGLPVWALLPVLGGILGALVFAGKKLLVKKKVK